MARQKRNRSKADMNVVPYIDVMLVLLVIFMISAPLLNQSVEVDLPASDNATEIVPKEDNGDELIAPMVISIDKDGLYYHSYAEDEASPVTEDVLKSLTITTIETHPDIDIYVRADKAVDYGQVMKAMEILKNVSAKKVGLMTSESDE